MPKYLPLLVFEKTSFKDNPATNLRGNGISGIFITGQVK